MRLSQIPTPALLLDPDRLARNAARMRERATTLGVTLRPHMKTAKSDEVGRVAHGGTRGPITVATLNEAEYFAAHGWTDLLYAVCIAPQKLDRVAAITARGTRLTVIVDSLSAAQAVAAHPGTHSALVEIDCGEDRTGVTPDDPALLAIGACLNQAPRCTLMGVLTHGGHSYEARDAPTITQIAEQERSACVAAAQSLRDAGLSCPVVSVGSTPTAVFASNLEGVTEMRPGVYRRRHRMQRPCHHHQPPKARQPPRGGCRGTGPLQGPKHCRHHLRCRLRSGARCTDGRSHR